MLTACNFPRVDAPQLPIPERPVMRSPEAEAIWPTKAISALLWARTPGPKHLLLHPLSAFSFSRSWRFNGFRIKGDSRRRNCLRPCVRGGGALSVIPGLTGPTELDGSAIVWGLQAKPVIPNFAGWLTPLIPSLIHHDLTCNTVYKDHDSTKGSFLRQHLGWWCKHTICSPTGNGTLTICFSSSKLCNCWVIELIRPMDYTYLLEASADQPDQTLLATFPEWLTLDQVVYAVVSIASDGSCGWLIFCPLLRSALGRNAFCQPFMSTHTNKDFPQRRLFTLGSYTWQPVCQTCLDMIPWSWNEPWFENEQWMYPQWVDAHDHVDKTDRATSKTTALRR